MVRMNGEIVVYKRNEVDLRNRTLMYDYFGEVAFNAVSF